MLQLRLQSRRHRAGLHSPQDISLSRRVLLLVHLVTVTRVVAAKPLQQIPAYRLLCSFGISPLVGVFA